jgi:hypothetical protein
MVKKSAKAKSSSKKDYTKIGDDDDIREPKSKGKGSTGRKNKGGASPSRRSKRNNGCHSNHDDAGLYAAIEAGALELVMKNVC